MSYQESLTLITLFFLLVAALHLSLYRRRCQGLSRKTAELERQRLALARECAELKQQSLQEQAFQQDLNRAAITTRLQRSRLDFQADAFEAAAPERYHYLSRLAEHGVAPEQIAELLSISREEARQLVCLARLCDRD